MIKAVVFDLDNTLYDYDSCNKVAEKCLFNLIADKFGIDEKVAAGLLSKAKDNIKRQLGEEVAASHNRLLYMQSICEQMGRSPFEYAMLFYNCYWESMLEVMEPFDYVLPLFNKLKDKGIKIAILTDLTVHIQYRKIAKLGIAEYIDCIVTSEEAGAEKPDSRMFLCVIDKLGFPPEEVLMVGDSIDKDILGAKSAGMETLLYENEVKLIETINSYSLL